MEIRALSAFVVVAEELNFRKAADRLNMTQPPLTRLISQLEFELGVPLFNRTTRRVELTGAGLYLLKKSREILSLVTHTELEVRSLHKRKSGTLEIALNSASIHSEVPRLLSSFKEQFPRIKISVTDSTLVGLGPRLKSGELDIAFGVNQFRDPEILSVEVQVRELGLLVSEENPLSLKKMIRLRDLDGETLIFHGKHEHLGFQEEFLNYLNWQGISPNVYYKKTSESCNTLVSSRRGCLLASKGLGKAPDNVVFVPLADYKPTLKIFAHSGKDNPSLALKAYLNFLSERGLVPRSEMDGHLA